MLTQQLFPYLGLIDDVFLRVGSTTHMNKGPGSNRLKWCDLVAEARMAILKHVQKQSSYKRGAYAKAFLRLVPELSAPVSQLRVHLSLRRHYCHSMALSVIGFPTQCAIEPTDCGIVNFQAPL